MTDDKRPQPQQPMDDDAFQKAMNARLFDGIPKPKDWRDED